MDHTPYNPIQKTKQRPLPNGMRPITLCDSDAARYCGVSVPVFIEMQKRGLLPPARRVNKRKLNIVAELDKAIAALPFEGETGSRPGKVQEPQQGLSGIEMPRRQQFKYIKRDVKGGKTYYYLRRPGFPSVRLPGSYGSLEFRLAFDDAMAQGAPLPIGASRTIPGSMNALILSFYRSSRFQNLRPSTAGVYRNILEKLRVDYGDHSVALMQPKHVRAIIEAKERPDARKRLLKMIRLLMKHACETGMRDSNPARDVQVKVPATSGFATWSEDQIGAFRAAYPIGSTARLVFELALNTGQRRGDLTRMGWGDLAGGEIVIRQQKTGQEVTIPVSPDLRAVLDAIPQDSAVIPIRGDRGSFATTGAGKPFTAAGLGNAFREWTRRLRSPRDCRSTGFARRLDGVWRKPNARRIKSWRSSATSC